MILRNYDNYQIIRDLYINGLDTDIYKSGFNLVNYSGTSAKLFSNIIAKGFSLFSFQQGANNFNVSSVGYSNLIVGSGDSVENYNDYKLNSIISTSDITAVSHKLEDPIYDEATSKWSRKYTKTFTAINDIVIKEIGVVATICAFSGNYTHHFLMYRKVLETPIEVPAGSNVVIDFKMVLNDSVNEPVATASVE